MDGPHGYIAAVGDYTPRRQYVYAQHKSSLLYMRKWVMSTKIQADIQTVLRLC